uniref:Putative PD-(D/E)XK nuclease superfamily protein n=1 Tax=viral metagenome TaxID=1070528 RepID=A0A6M3K0X8_9ZZZZ
MVSNTYNLPEPLVKALTPDRKAPVFGRISVTSLIDSPLRRVLAMRYYGQTNEDVSEGLWALLGTMGHRVLEGGSDCAEVKIEAPFNGATLVGVVDHTKDGEVIDFKFTSVWSVVFPKPENELQLQIYAYLVQSTGLPVTKLSNWMILRDWNKREAQRNQEMPRIAFHKISYKPWPKDKIEAYLTERVSLHLSAEKYAQNGSQEEIPASLWCSPEERWERPSKWAAKTVGKDRAVRLFDSEQECSDFVHGTKMFLEHRPGESVKCNDYCQYSAWCPRLNSPDPGCAGVGADLKREVQ